MDWLTETPAYGTTLAPQLMGVKILEICAVALFLLTVLTFIAGWVWHLSGRVRLLALVPLAAGLVAAITAHILHDTYVSWVYYFDHLPPTAPPNLTLDHKIATANQTATELGWVFAIVTGVLLALSLIGWWRLRTPGSHRRASTTLALDS